MKYKILINKTRLDWLKYRVRHRVNGPATEYADGRKIWLKSGVYLRG